MLAVCIWTRYFVAYADKWSIFAYSPRILYAAFVASSEHVTIADLAITLGADLTQLEYAISLACRLGWAKKLNKNAPRQIPDESERVSAHISFTQEEEVFQNENKMQLLSLAEDEPLAGLLERDRHSSQTGLTRFALLVDTTLTSYLMMGSLFQG